MLLTAPLVDTGPPPDPNTPPGSGYGSGLYGAGPYGGTDNYPTTGYGSGLYGYGYYGGVAPDPGSPPGDDTPPAGVPPAQPPITLPPAAELFPTKPTIAQLAGRNWIRF